MTTHAGYIIAGPTAIWAAADTEAAAYAAYVRDTGDDSLSLDDMRAARPGAGKTYIMPATARLLDHVGSVGGDTSWDDSDDVADVIEESE
jgi:hypothetical protein